jgi:hypothetical protein
MMRENRKKQANSQFFHLIKTSNGKKDSSFFLIYAPSRILHAHHLPALFKRLTLCPLVTPISDP